MQILKIKLKGEIYKTLVNIDIPNIQTFIEYIRKLYPSIENIHTLYGNLTQSIQKSDETVLEYGNKIRQIGTKINELKSLEPNIAENDLALFKTRLETEILNSFRNGLKQEIRLELGEQANAHTAIQKAIEIELKLANQKMLRNETANILLNFERPNNNITRISQCQICQDRYHEALFCLNSSCVYCKNRDHVSYFCCTAKDKIELICNYCNSRGHSVDKCQVNPMQGNHCQYCQEMGHTVTQCHTIKKYELCWKCKEKGHSPIKCEKSASVTESCDTCGNTSHTEKNCPSAVCQRCNKPGHSMKYCTIDKKIWCAICTEPDHEASDCESAKILMMQNKQFNATAKLVCQLCNETGHVVKYCPEYNMQCSRNTNNVGQSTNYGNNERKTNQVTYNRNTHGYGNRNQQTNYRSTNFNHSNNER